MQQPNKKKSSKKPWYKKSWGVVLIILSVITLTFPIVLFVLMWQSKKFPKWAKITITVFVAIVAVGAANSEESGNQASQNDKTAQTSEQTAEDIVKQQTEDEAAKEITKTLIEGYVPRYCETHQQKNVPLPPADGGQYGNGKSSLNIDECRAIITYLVERVGSSAQSLESISSGKITIGMNRHELLMSWGVPSDTNNTTTVGGKSSQWVYGNPIYGANYVYLDNDVITAIQN